MQEKNFVHKEFIKWEEKNNLYSVKYNNELVWSFLRMDFRFWIIKKRNNWGRKLRGRNQISLLRGLRLFFFGFMNWFKSYEYIVLNDSINRKFIDGQYVSKDFDHLHKVLKHRLLFMETTKGFFEPRALVKTKHIVSGMMVIFFSRLLSFFVYLDSSWVNISYFEKLKEFNFNFKKNLKIHIVKRAIFKLIFRIYKPKAIFVNCYYSNIPAIQAAKSLSIKVIEIQHGEIGENHTGYILSKYFPRGLLPDNMLLYGQEDKQNLLKNKKYLSNELYVVGSNFIDLYKNKRSKNIKNLDLNNLDILITSQNSIDSKIFEFAKNIALNFSNLNIWFLPRGPSDHEDEKLPRNLNVLKDKSFYEACCDVDIHSTVYSTTARESFAMGLPNIFLDIKGLSTTYMANNMPEGKNIRYIKSPEEYEKAISELDFLNKANDNQFYKSNCMLNTQNAIKDILEEKHA